VNQTSSTRSFATLSTLYGLRYSSMEIACRPDSTFGNSAVFSKW